MTLAISPQHARAIWLRAQKLDETAPFGSGPEATKAAVEHLGYVQIDTINVIERCHHHILYSRIPDYRRADLMQAQSLDKSVFEYWTHALSYVPTRDLRFYLPAMKAHRRDPSRWYANAQRKDVLKLLRRIREEGALSIRDIDDDVLVEKEHLWASRKPSKQALQMGFFNGELAISARAGMVKTYELFERHFGFEEAPKPATENQISAYLLDRALQAQGMVSLDSICHLNAKAKPAVKALIEARVKRRQLVPVGMEGVEGPTHWISPALLDSAPASLSTEPVHVLSPFDPLIIQRKRLKLFFGYDHLFEAYVKPEKRVYGYFALPVLIGDRVVAVIDTKTDRQSRKLLIQKRTDLGALGAEENARIDEALAQFERFQLADLV